MFRRVFACVLAVSALLVMTSPAMTLPLPNLPKGSTVFIAPMAGFDSYLRAATRTIDLPLVFVGTRAQADYEITGFTKEVRPAVEGVSNVRTTLQDTTIWVKNIGSGQTVFTHSVKTTLTSPNKSDSLVDRATRTPTPSRLLASAKETAAKHCAQALQAALSEKP
jgi:hypothetical protein